MAFGAKALIAVCAIGGGGSAPWILRQFNIGNSTVSSDPLSTFTSDNSHHSSRLLVTKPEAEKPDHVPTDSLPQPSLIPKKVNSENCLVEKELQDLETLMWESLDYMNVNLDTFIRVKCSNANLDQDSKIPSQWSGLFPNTLFKDRQEITEGKKIEIKVKTETIEDSINYKTTFSGSHFYDKITGELTKTNPDETDKKITEVKIISPEGLSEKIYLLFNQ